LLEFARHGRQVFDVPYDGSVPSEILEGEGWLDLLPKNSTSGKERVERQEGAMRSNRYSEEQIIGILKEVSTGKSVREVIRVIEKNGLRR
jgi:hypothetical protein